MINTDQNKAIHAQENKSQSTSDGYMPSTKYRNSGVDKKDEAGIDREIKRQIRENKKDTPQARNKVYMKSRGLRKKDINRGQVS